VILDCSTALTSAGTKAADSFAGITQMMQSPVLTKWIRNYGAQQEGCLMNTYTSMEQVLEEQQDSGTVMAQESADVNPR
jgi:hypothetical protein